MVMKPLWVLTGSVTGTVVSTGSTVGSTTGTAVVVSGRAGSRVGWWRVGGMVGDFTTGVVGTVDSGIVEQGPFNLCCPPARNRPLTLGWWATGGYRPLYIWGFCGGIGPLKWW